MGAVVSCVDLVTRCRSVSSLADRCLPPGGGGGIGRTTRRPPAAPFPCTHLGSILKIEQNMWHGGRASNFVHFNHSPSKFFLPFYATSL